MKKAVESGEGTTTNIYEIFPKGKKIDISDYLYLFYRYPKREHVNIPQPLTITVGDDGHKVTDAFGGNHVMPNGFFHIKYKLKGDDIERTLVEN